jgi:hypothetical protein
MTPHGRRPRRGRGPATGSAGVQGHSQPTCPRLLLTKPANSCAATGPETGGVAALAPLGGSEFALRAEPVPELVGSGILEVQEVRTPGYLEVTGAPVDGLCPPRARPFGVRLRGLFLHRGSPGYVVREGHFVLLCSTDRLQALSAGPRGTVRAPRILSAQPGMRLILGWGSRCAPWRAAPEFPSQNADGGW